ncbi:MAG: two-component regulator propeller domain-containing protein [Acidobacteriaceae bacterium]
MRNSLVAPFDLRILRHCMCCAIVLLVARGAWAISPADSPIGTKYIRTDFTVDDGLPDNTINAITQTENGLLWVGTTSGLASFDGRTFTTVRLQIPGALPPGTVSSLVEGPDGDLWVGTDAGVVRIPQRDLNDPYLPDATAFRLGKQQSEEVEVLFSDRGGTIWAGTSHGLYRFDGNRFICVNWTIYVGRISQALDGRLMLNTGSGFVEFDGKRIIQRVGLGAQFGVSDDEIFDALQDPDGTIWYCTSKGIYPVAGQRVTSLSPYRPAHASAYRIFVSPTGAHWVSTQAGIYEIVGEHMRTPDPYLHARYFYAGKDGDLWIGTNGAGLVHLQPRTVQMFTKADGLPSDIAMAVLPTHDGRLWVGENCGLAVFDGRHFRTFDQRDGLTNACVWSLAEDRQHTIWIGTYGGGLFRYRNGVFKQYTRDEGLVSRIVGQIMVARDDTLWLATPNGVSHLRDRGIRNYTAADGLSSIRVHSIYQDHAGTIWVATQAGVDRLDSGRFVPVPATRAADEIQVRQFIEDSQGNLYATDLPQGISEIRNGRVTPLDSALSLAEMVEAPDHTLWFSGRNGVVRVAEQEFARVGKTSTPLDYEVFDRADGLNTTEASVGTPNIAIDSNGKLWIATVKGLAMIDTLHLPLTGRSPQVFITGVSSDTKRCPVGNGLVLKPGIHHVELTLAAINLANPQRVRLQYRLEGVDSQWLDATSSRTAVYSNIPVGTHGLLVRVTDSIGHWSAPEVVYELTQRPHFYAQTPFQVSVAIAVVLLLLLAYFVRMRSVVRQTRIIIEQRQIERETVARDLHDTFLQGVQGLILRFHTGTQQLPPENPVRQSFEEALNQSDRIMIEGRGVLSRLRTKRTKPETLTEAYAAIGGEFRALSPAQFEAFVSGRSRDLDVVVQEELEKIGREALFNAYLHANASRIEVEIHFGIFDFRVRFRDDGIGIDPAILREGSVPNHFGLPGMRERVSKIGGKLEIWSRPGAGTEIEIRVPGLIAYRDYERKVKPRWIRRLLRRRDL